MRTQRNKEQVEDFVQYIWKERGIATLYKIATRFNMI